MADHSERPFRVGFVPGVMPGKWERLWRERMRRPLALVPVEVDAQLRAIREGAVDMCLVRGEIPREGLHLIPLYAEAPVVVASVEHPVAAFEEIDVSELAGELDVLEEFPELDLRQAVATVAAGTGFVVVPKSLARLHQRKDVVAVPATGVPDSPVGLAWMVDNDDPDVQVFIGIVRGRTANSSRG